MFPTEVAPSWPAKLLAPERQSEVASGVIFETYPQKLPGLARKHQIPHLFELLIHLHHLLDFLGPNANKEKEPPMPTFAAPGPQLR